MWLFSLSQSSLKTQWMGWSWLRFLVFPSSKSYIFSWIYSLKLQKELIKINSDWKGNTLSVANTCISGFKKKIKVYPLRNCYPSSISQSNTWLTMPLHPQSLLTALPSIPLGTEDFLFNSRTLLALITQEIFIEQLIYIVFNLYTIPVR